MRSLPSSRRRDRQYFGGPRAGAYYLPAGWIGVPSPWDGASGSTTVSMQCQASSDRFSTLAESNNASVSAVQVENLVKPAG